MIKLIDNALAQAILEQVEQQRDLGVIDVAKLTVANAELKAALGAVGEQLVAAQAAITALEDARPKLAVVPPLAPLQGADNS